MKEIQLLKCPFYLKHWAQRAQSLPNLQRFFTEREQNIPSFVWNQTPKGPVQTQPSWGGRPGWRHLVSRCHTALGSYRCYMQNYIKAQKETRKSTWSRVWSCRTWTLNFNTQHKKAVCKENKKYRGIYQIKYFYSVGGLIQKKSPPPPRHHQQSVTHSELLLIFQPSLYLFSWVGPKKSELLSAQTQPGAFLELNARQS